MVLTESQALTDHLEELFNFGGGNKTNKQNTTMQTDITIADPTENIISGLESHYAACNAFVSDFRTRWTAAIIRRDNIIASLVTEVQGLESARDVAQSESSAAQSTVATHENTITNLQAQVAQLQIDLAAAQAQLNQ